MHCRPGPSPRASDSAGLGWAGERAFLTSSQVMRMLLAQHHKEALRCGLRIPTPEWTNGRSTEEQSPSHAFGFVYGPLLQAH